MTIITSRVIEEELNTLLTQIPNIDNVRDALKWTRSLTTVVGKTKSLNLDSKFSETLFNTLLKITNILLDLLHADEETESIYGNSAFEVLTKVLSVVQEYERKLKNNQQEFVLTESQNLALSIVKEKLIGNKPHE